MNKRTVAIVEKLVQSDQRITLESLAEDFQISQRSIRNDLKEINEILSNNGFQELSLKSGGVVEKAIDLSQAMPLFVGEDFYTYKLSREERIRAAAVEIVNAAGYITLSRIADSLYVSRATIIGDLPGIRELLKNGNLELVSHSNKGLRINGKESAKRLFILKMVAPDIGTAQENVIGRYIHVQAGDRIVIRKIVEEQEHVHGSYLTDTSFQRILIYLGIMVNRNLAGEYVETMEPRELSKYRMAQDIVKYISQYCRIQSTADEVEFLSEILVWARYMKQDSYQGDSVRVQMLTRRFIEQISDELGVNLNRDYDFYENLSNHIQSVFSAKPVQYPESAVLDQALEEHPEVLPAVLHQQGMLERFAGRTITADEMKYVSIHVCAALERQKNKQIAFHVIVACHAGIGTSQLLMEKLKEHFNFRIVDVVSSHEAENLDEDAADFVISTVPLKNCRLEYVLVSPLLNDEDYLRVGNKIDTLRSSRHLPSREQEEETAPKELMRRISPVLYEEAPEQAAALEKKIRRVILNFYHQNEDEGNLFAPRLHQLLPASHIQLDVACKDWKDAVRKSAEPLAEEGYIEERYIDAMISNIEENGPYVVLAKGFAVPHEGVDMGSIRVGMNLIRLKEPVPFGAEELDPVRFVCTLSAVDHQMHLKAFFNLVNMLKTDGFLEELTKAGTPAQAAAVIQRYEYQLEES